MKKIVLIGSGNVATHLGQALYNKGVEILQVWSQSLDNANILAHKINSQGISDMQHIVADADAYIFSVKDDALTEVLQRFPYADKMIFHTAGSVAASLLAPFSSHYGVLYPFQTFSKAKELDFSEVPILLEASDDGVMKTLRELAESISQKVILASSAQRKYLHIAGVFACNFTNHLYSIAEEVLTQNDLEFDLIKPLITETAQKAMLHSPKTVQTGPAARKDKEIINAHLEMLEDNPELHSLYRLLSERIMKEA